MPEEKIENPVVPPVDTDVPAEKPDSEKTVEELKAEAEAAEAKYKEARGSTEEEELKANMIRRRDKANEKLVKVTTGEPVTEKKNEISARDLIALNNAGFEEGSKEAEVLQKYVKGGLAKDFKEALLHVGAQAEINAIKADMTAKSVIDENDTDEIKLNTGKEVIADYKVNGNVPQDKAGQQLIARNNLKEMGFIK
jgi:hypothetical protein